MSPYGTNPLPPVPPAPPERRASTRGRFGWAWDLLFRALRLVARYAHGFYTTVGIFLLGSTVVAVAATWGFTKVAVHVRRGSTQAFDDAVLRWIALHKSPLVEAAMFEVTFLGTGLVVMMIVAVSAMFLWLTQHRHSSMLLLVSTAGSIILNNLLKLGFDRPRPQVFTWGAHVVSSSFPSGHATSAAVVYGTVAYLAARLQRRTWSRVVTMLLAFVMIVLICISRLYLGVHYPSDVLAGVLVGFAWAGFCMATLEAMQLLARRLAPQAVEQEVDERHEPESPLPAGDIPVRREA